MGREQPGTQSHGSADFHLVYRSPAGEVQLAAAEVVSASGSAQLHHRLTFGADRAGAVAIGRRLDGAVLLTSSFRLAANRRLLELPRGLIEPADQLAQDQFVAAGERELLEETGFGASSAQLLGVCIVDSAVYPLRVGIVLCEIRDPYPIGPPDGEVDDIRWIPHDELDGMIVAGHISDGLSLMALAMLRAHERAGEG